MRTVRSVTQSVRLCFLSFVLPFMEGWRSGSLCFTRRSMDKETENVLKLELYFPLRVNWVISLENMEHGTLDENAMLAEDK